jgi:6-phosphogluconate dehydrogenase (decarboxylating)
MIGLGRTGGTTVRRIHRDSNHQIVAFDFGRAAGS